MAAANAAIPVVLS